MTQPSQIYRAGEHFPAVSEIEAMAAQVFAPRDEIPGVSPTDFDLALFPRETGEPYAALHIESRPGGDALLRWLGAPQTQAWLRTLVGGAPLVWQISLRRLGPTRPTATHWVRGRGAGVVYATVCVQADESGCSFEFGELDHGASDSEATVVVTEAVVLSVGDALISPNTQTRREAEALGDGLVLEFYACADGADDDVMRTQGWTQIQLAARRRTVGIARQIASPGEADAIGAEFTPPLRTPAEELPLTRVLAAPVPPTELVGAHFD